MINGACALQLGHPKGSLPNTIDYSPRLLRRYGSHKLADQSIRFSFSVDLPFLIFHSLPEAIIIK